MVVVGGAVVGISGEAEEGSVLGLGSGGEVAAVGLGSILVSVLVFVFVVGGSARVVS